MPYFRECPKCHGTLDPHEKCDCDRTQPMPNVVVKQKDNCNLFDLVATDISDVTLDEIIVAIKPATMKLQRIIQREGDADGERIKAYYIARLVVEQIRQARMSQHCRNRYKEKEYAAEASAPL